MSLNMEAGTDLGVDPQEQAEHLVATVAEVRARGNSLEESLEAVVAQALEDGVSPDTVGMARAIIDKLKLK